MTGLETLLVILIWGVIFFVTSVVISKMEQHKEEKQLLRNMEEQRLRRNRRITFETVMAGYETDTCRSEKDGE